MEGINRDSWCWLYATEAINCSNDAKSCRKHFITLYLLFQNFSGFCTWQTSALFQQIRYHRIERAPRNIEGHDRRTC